MHIRLIAAAWAVLISAAAMADDSPYSSAHTACIHRSAGVTVEMLNCTQAEYELQDQQLNTAYKALMAILPRKDGATLRSAQRDWLRARQSTCDFHGRVSEGSMAALNAKSCFLEETARRAALLTQWQSLKDMAR